MCASRWPRKRASPRGRRPCAIVLLLVGLGDVAAVRRGLGAALAEATPPMSLSATCGQFLEVLRSDPEIDRLLFGLYGW